MLFSTSKYCNGSELRPQGPSRMIEALSFGLKLYYEGCLHLSDASDSVTTITPLYDSRIHEIKTKIFNKIKMIRTHED